MNAAREQTKEPEGAIPLAFPQTERSFLLQLRRTLKRELGRIEKRLEELGGNEKEQC
jgi:hypothetical protein